MKLIKGNELSGAVCTDVLRSFVHRMTKENIKQQPAMAKRAFDHGYKMPIISDTDWLKDHAFYVTNAGNLSCRHNHCEPAFMTDTPDTTQHLLAGVVVTTRQLGLINDAVLRYESELTGREKPHCYGIARELREAWDLIDWPRIRDEEEYQEDQS